MFDLFCDVVCTFFWCLLFFFFFKQKTAYELRISDWSADVCSSDLLLRHGRDFRHIRDSAIVRGMVQRGTNVLDIALDALAFDAFRCVVIVLTLPRNSIAMRSRAPRDESLN